MTAPPLAIGLPVYNGENFLAGTLDSILTQTYGDFELIITDNASSDSTPDICRDYADDPRIRYHRHPTNLGAAANYTSCFERSSSPFFKWAAHDDPCAPNMLERCMSALRDQPDAVLAFARTLSIDAEGRQLKLWRLRPALGSPDVRIRTHDVLTKQETFPIWGVTRRDVLARTGLLGGFTEHDRPLLYQLVLHGPFAEVEEPLFFDREHSERSVRAYDHTDPYTAAVWYDTQLEARLIFPKWRLLGEYLRALHRSPIPVRHYGAHLADLTRWASHHRTELTRDLSVAMAHTPLIGGRYQKVAGSWAARRWRRHVERTIRAFDVIPGGERLVLIDEGVLDRSRLKRLNIREFPEEAGYWAGLPESSEHAIRQLDAEIAAGASHLAVVSTSRWWLDHYDAFARYLTTVASLVVETNDTEVYRLSRGGPSGESS